MIGDANTAGNKHLKKMANYKTFIACADNHGELICKKASKVFLDFAKDLKAHYRIHLGDVWDFSPLRKGASQEDKAEGISADYAQGWSFLEAYQPTHLTLGNHDDRIWMHTEKCADGLVKERCQELASEAEDNFRKMRMQFVPYHIDKYLQLPEGGPKLIHGFHANMYPAKAHYLEWSDCLFGHVHKPDFYEARHIDGGKSFALGCLADIQRMEYAKKTPSRLGWRNSFLYGRINTRTGRWHAWSVTKEKTGEWVSPHGIL